MQINGLESNWTNDCQHFLQLFKPKPASEAQAGDLPGIGVVVPYFAKPRLVSRSRAQIAKWLHDKGTEAARTDGRWRRQVKLTHHCPV